MPPSDSQQNIQLFVMIAESNTSLRDFDPRNEVRVRLLRGNEDANNNACNRALYVNQSEASVPRDSVRNKTTALMHRQRRNLELKSTEKVFGNSVVSESV